MITKTFFIKETTYFSSLLTAADPVLHIFSSCNTKMYCLEKSRLKNRISHMYYWKTCDKAFLSSQINFEWYISSLRVGS